MAMAPSETGVTYIAERRHHPRTPVLNSWKEIAEYLKCGVRTAQRWELDLDLPVYRPRPGKRGPVCAFPTEIQLWLRQRGTNHKSNGQAGWADSPARISHELTLLSSELVRRTAANTRLQRQYTARLLETIETLKARIERRGRLGRAS